MQFCDFQMATFSQSGDSSWYLHLYLASESFKIHDKLTLLCIIIQCQQQASKDNYCSFRKYNSGYYTVSVIDYFYYAECLKLIRFTCKVRKNDKNVGTVERTYRDYK